MGEQDEADCNDLRFSLAYAYLIGYRKLARPAAKILKRRVDETLNRAWGIMAEQTTDEGKAEMMSVIAEGICINELLSLRLRGHRHDGNYVGAFAKLKQT